MKMFGVTRDFPLAKAMNLVTSKPASDIALAAPSPKGYMLTLVPWHGRALVGTWQSDTLATPADLAPTAAEVDAFIADAKRRVPRPAPDAGGRDARAPRDRPRRARRQSGSIPVRGRRFSITQRTAPPAPCRSSASSTPPPEHRSEARAGRRGRKGAGWIDAAD
jgi:hypothetical protein